MQLRYAFRLYPDSGQQTALAKAFGCARVVFNDAVRAREDARTAGQPFPTAGELSRKLITEAKQTAERSWLGEVSAVVLQQSLRDVETAYRNFFASLKGDRKGPKMGAPRFKSRKDNRQSIRFTANARWYDHRQRAAEPAEDRGGEGEVVPHPARHPVLGHRDQGRGRPVLRLLRHRHRPARRRRPDARHRPARSASTWA